MAGCGRWFFQKASYVLPAALPADIGCAVLGSLLVRVCRRIESRLDDWSSPILGSRLIRTRGEGDEDRY